MTGTSLNLIQSLLLIFGLCAAFFGRDYCLDYRSHCRKAFVLFCGLLVFNQVTVAKYCTTVHGPRTADNTNSSENTDKEYRTIILKSPIHASFQRN